MNVTARDALTRALHRHTCGNDYDEWNQPCAWAGEDWDYDNGPATCAYVDEIGVEAAVLGWVAALADDEALVREVDRGTGIGASRLRVVIRHMAAVLTERTQP